jgi:hypothetical protein
MVLIAQLILHNLLYGHPWTIPKTIYSYLISNPNYHTSFVTTIPLLLTFQIVLPSIS